MEKLKTQYPDFDVMKESEHWDHHTRQIVENRLQLDEYKTLSPVEASCLVQICAILLYDERSEILKYVVHHFDQTLTADIGEDQRKQTTPKQSILIRTGLRALDQHSTTHFGALFAGLEQESQKKILDDVMRGNVNLDSDGVSIPAQEFFKKLLTMSVSAYYSHPTVWSEIGYAGPAYPRGYVRSEWGLTDPWEAKRRKKGDENQDEES